MGATLNFIDIGLKLLEENYAARRVAYITAMKEMLKKIPLTMIKSLTTEQKFQKLMTDISGGWYTETIAKGLPPINRSELGKKVQDKEYEIKKHMKLISVTN